MKYTKILILSFAYCDCNVTFDFSILYGSPVFLFCPGNKSAAIVYSPSTLFPIVVSIFFPDLT